MMSNFNTLDFTRRIKSNPDRSHIPLIMISAKHEIEDQIAALNAGAELYVTMPFNVDFSALRSKSYSNVKKHSKRISPPRSVPSNL